MAAGPEYGGEVESDDERTELVMQSLSFEKTSRTCFPLSWWEQ